MEVKGMENTNKDLLKVVTQAFYGNKTGTEVRREDLDGFILGYVDNSLNVTEKIDRTIIKVPNAENIVIVYNKYQEEKELLRKEELLRDKNYELKPLVVIPQLNIKLYSRCVVCRINENGELESLQSGDYKKFAEYLAD